MAGDQYLPGGFSMESHREEGPKQGWRKTVAKVIPIGKSAAEKEYDHDIFLINKQLRYPRVVGVAGFKGGTGKTSTVVCLGSTIGEHRATGAVVGVDADEHGTLPMRMRGQRVSDVKSFAADTAVNTPSDMRSHMMSNTHRFSVLGSSAAHAADPLSADEYTTALEKIKKFADVSLILVDMDTSAASPSYESVMHSLDALVLVTAPTMESARLGQEMLSWIREHDLGGLLSRTTVLINHHTPTKSYVNLDEVIAYFQGQEKLKVYRVPWDEHLAEAGPVSLSLLNKGTRRRFVRVAAHVVNSLPAS
jgi:MinD-like ATPase involved in chromosome partitioning or flagellar assembly